MGKRRKEKKRHCRTVPEKTLLSKDFIKPTLIISGKVIKSKKFLRFLFGLLDSDLVSELQPSLSSQKQTPPLHPCRILGIAQNID